MRKMYQQSKTILLLALFRKRLLSLAVIFFILFSVPGFSLAEDLTYTGQEIIRNGDFEESIFSAWFTNLDIASGAAEDGRGGITSYRLNNARREGVFFQKLTIPSQLQSATIQFDYRVIHNEVTETPSPINLEVYLAQSPGLTTENLIFELANMDRIGDIHTESFDQPMEWQTFSVDISADLIAQTQAAHDEGNFVFLVFSFQSETDEWTDIVAHIDNISLLVTGTQSVPQLPGKIAFFETPAGELPPGSTFSGSINILDPNTGGIDPIWNSPSMMPEVKFRPDGSRIAIVDGEASDFSPFYADILTIKPDGTDAQQVTGQPGRKTIENGNYPRVNLTGTIENHADNSLRPTTINICAVGADECAPLTIPSNQTAPFAINNVAAMGDSNHFEQRAVVYWSNGNCENGLEYKIFEGDISEGSVDLGTISLDANNCVTSVYRYMPSGIAWNNDASAIGAGIIDGRLRKFDAVNGTPLMGAELPSPENQTAGNLAWSPIDNQYLFCAFDRPTALSAAIYIAEEGGEPRVLIQNAARVTPTWLPDGSGFYFVRSGLNVGNNIFHYDLATQQTRQLTFFSMDVIDGVSISPDAGHLVFERCLNYTSSCNLWILDLANPAEIWPITTGDQRKTSPDWGPVAVDNGTSPQDSGNSADGDGGGGDGSGGCFINAL